VDESRVGWIVYHLARWHRHRTTTCAEMEQPDVLDIMWARQMLEEVTRG